MLVKEWIAPTPGQSWQYFYSADHLCPFQWHYHPEFELTFTQNAAALCWRRCGGIWRTGFSLGRAQSATYMASGDEYRGSLQTVQVAFFDFGVAANTGGAGSA